jgi:murein DD-endopeptidase MepM/ murein hydrolase activator NlpD
VRKVILLILVLAVVAPFVFLIARSATPQIEVNPQVTVVGEATPVTVRVHDPRGVRHMAAFVEQGGARYAASENSLATKTADSDWNFTLGVKSAPQLHEGDAKLIVEATSNDFAHKTAHWEGSIRIVTRPPSISTDGEQHYLYQGMAELTTFSVTGGWTDAGVRVGDQKFRSWPAPGGKAGRFSLFAFAWNMPASTPPVVYASNGTGSDVTSPLVAIFPKKEQPKYTTHELQISDAFLNKVVNELDANGKGDTVARFVKINNDMRRENNKTLSELRLKTADHFLWSQPFARQHAAAESSFADLRNYIYQGKKIDQQVHLGYDLAGTQHMGVQASNDGRVVYAAPLGIYGNCIVVDHGYGLQTIYGHLSQINVHEGDTVKRGQVMGLSGMTGMAGGDHIHFAMQLDGVQIDPKEWWDPHWIKDHVAKRVDLPGFKE